MVALKTHKPKNSYSRKLRKSIKSKRGGADLFNDFLPVPQHTPGSKPAHEHGPSLSRTLSPAHKRKSSSSLPTDTSVIDWDIFFSGVKTIQTKFNSITAKGISQNISIPFGKPASSGVRPNILVKDLINGGRLNIMLLLETSVVREIPIRIRFEQNDGLVFYRSVYVEHFIKLIKILDSINKQLKPPVQDPDLNFSISFFEGQKAMLEQKEETEKGQSLTILHEEETAINTFYQTPAGITILKTMNAIVQSEPANTRLRQLNIFKRDNYFTQNKIKSTINLSNQSICNISKFIFYGLKSPNDLLKIHYNGVQYSQQHYKKTDTDETVKTKLKQIFLFLEQNVSYLLAKDKYLIEKDPLDKTAALKNRKEYLERLKSSDNCKSIVSMLKFYDHDPSGGTGTGVSESSLADLEARLLGLQLPSVSTLAPVAPIGVRTAPRTGRRQLEALGSVHGGKKGSRKGKNPSKPKRKGSKKKKKKGKK
jgi:hypothetical protein